MKKNRNFAVYSAVFLILAALFAGFFWSLYLFSGNTPAITLPEQPVDSSSDAAGTAPGLSVRENTVPFTVTSENVLAALATLRRPDVYQFETETVLFSGEESASFRALCYNRNGSAKTEFLNEQGMPERHEITGLTKVFIWHTGDRQVFSAPSGSGITEDDSRRIPTYEDLFALSPEDLYAGEAVTLAGESCLYAAFRDPVTEEEQRYWVSVASGLLRRAEVWDRNGTPVLTMERSEVSFTVPDEVFLLPDGSFAWDAES